MKFDTQVAFGHLKKVNCSDNDLGVRRNKRFEKARPGPGCENHVTLFVSNGSPFFTRIYVR